MTLSINVEKRSESVFHSEIQDLFTMPCYFYNYQEGKLHLIHIHFKCLIKWLLISDCVTVLYAISTELLGEIQHNIHTHALHIPMCVYVQIAYINRAKNT